ncbi:hypothetical protein DOZ91_15925 [Peribacillus frigoritolerans]|nr:hypothetical protein DOZ91_15925 [Peribacillus frigoritolerans]
MPACQFLNNRLYVCTDLRYKSVKSDDFPHSYNSGSITSFGKSRGAMTRLIMIPLMDKALEEPENILMMHQFCNKEEYVYHHAISIGLIGGYIAFKMKCNSHDFRKGI